MVTEIYKAMIPIPLFEVTKDYLAGVVLICNDKVLLVKPTKYANVKGMWSFPKGHVEDKMSRKDTAFKELEEETGITIGGDTVVEKFKIRYRRDNLMKDLKLYVIYIDEKEIEPHLGFSNHEIKKIGLFDYKTARRKLQKDMVQALDYIFTRVIKKVA